MSKQIDDRRKIDNITRTLPQCVCKQCFDNTAKELCSGIFSHLDINKTCLEMASPYVTTYCTNGQERPENWEQKAVKVNFCCCCGEKIQFVTTERMIT